MGGGPFENAEGGWGLKTINASFSFWRPPKTHTLTIFGGIKSF